MGVEEAGRLREQAARLITERRGLERGLVGRHRLLGGSLLERPNLCGKAGCKCTRSEPRASSLYLIRLEGGTPRHVFVRAADHKRVMREDPAHRQFRQAVRRWRAVVKELNLPWEALGEAQGGAMDPSFFDAKAVSNYRESCYFLSENAFLLNPSYRIVNFSGTPEDIGDLLHSYRAEHIVLPLSLPNTDRYRQHPRFSSQAFEPPEATIIRLAPARADWSTSR